MLNKRYIKSIKFVLISFPVFLFHFFFCFLLERKDKKWFKRDIIVLISFLILFVSISFLVNIGKEMSLPVKVYSFLVNIEPIVFSPLYRIDSIGKQWHLCLLI